MRPGRLGNILLHLPWYFEDNSKYHHRLRTLSQKLQPLPLFIRARHNSFLSPKPQGSLRYLDQLALQFTNIDLPLSRTSPSLTPINTGPQSHFRLHGRNHGLWFDRQAGRDEKYNYLYTIDALRVVASAIERVAAWTQTTYVITNNHFHSQTPTNAFQLMGILGRADLQAPSELETKSPELAVTKATSA